MIKIARNKIFWFNGQGGLVSGPYQSLRGDEVTLTPGGVDGWMRYVFLKPFPEGMEGVRDPYAALALAKEKCQRVA